MRFDPTLFSQEECEFLKTHANEPPIVAMKSLPLPGVNPRAVRPVLEGLQELKQLAQADAAFVWKGVGAVIEAIETWQEQNTKWARDTRRGAPRYPSRYSFTSRGKPLLSGPGSDNHTIKTYFRSDGSRAEFAVDLLTDGAASWVPEWIDRAVAEPEKEAPKPVSLTLTVNSELNRIECGVCGHTESFNGASRQSYNSARGRISRHLRKPNSLPNEHTELHTQEFRS